MKCINIEIRTDTSYTSNSMESYTLPLKNDLPFLSPLITKSEGLVKSENIQNPQDPPSQFNDLSSIYNKKIRKILICIVGGPGIGKTTTLNNVLSILTEQYNLNIKDIFIVSHRLLDSLDYTNNKSIENIVKSGNLIIIDNRFIDKGIIDYIIKFSEFYFYRTVIIHPWVNFSTLEKRLFKRKKEVGRDFNLDYYWQKHMMFYHLLHSYITEICPFDIIIIYNNNNDDIKKILYAKIMSEEYLVNKEFINKLEERLNNRKEINNISIENDHKTTKFISKKEYMTYDLQVMFNLLFDDLLEYPLGKRLSNYLDEYIQNQYSV